MALIKGSSEPISYKTTNKIIETMKNCICRIKFEEIFGTAFFCFIPYKNKKLPVMISNNHIINENILKNDKISVEIYNENKTIYLTDRKIYTNRKYDITIIEINPEKDCIYDFLELEESILIEKDVELKYKDISIYILQIGENDNFVSYGILRDINQNEGKLRHLCSTISGSGGAPIINLKNLKIIGIHVGSNMNYKYNIGTFLKYPINEFINKNKDYLESIIESPNTFPLGLKENKISDDEINIINFNKIKNELEIALNKEKEKNKKLEEQIIKLKLISNNNNINNYKDFNKNKQDDVIVSLLKKDKEIEDLKTKLERFPFELSQREKLMSIIITSSDKKINCSIICKNTEMFYNIETKFYQKYPEYSENENNFFVNGKKILKHKSLDYNKIKDYFFQCLFISE